MTGTKKRSWRAPWSAAAGQRLRMAIAAAGFTQNEIRDETGKLITRSTLSGWLSGAQSPPMERLEAICRQLKVDIGSVISDPGETATLNESRRNWGAEMLERISQRPLRATTLDVPVYDIEVAAGHGRTALDEQPVAHWPLPVGWIADNIAGDPDLMIVRVSGDSQEPELREGDALIVDRRQTRLRAGMHVVRRDDDLLVKRIQLEGRKVLLLSANSRYETIVIDRETDKDGFQVIGRAVAAIKLL